METVSDTREQSLRRLPGEGEFSEERSSDRHLMEGRHPFSLQSQRHQPQPAVGKTKCFPSTQFDTGPVRCGAPSDIEAVHLHPASPPLKADRTPAFANAVPGVRLAPLNIDEARREGPERLREHSQQTERKGVAAHEPLEVSPRQGETFAISGRLRSGRTWSIVQESHFPEHVPGSPNRQLFLSTARNGLYDFNGPRRHDEELVVPIPFIEQAITRTCFDSLEDPEECLKLVVGKSLEEIHPAQAFGHLLRQKVIALGDQVSGPLSRFLRCSVDPKYASAKAVGQDAGSDDGRYSRRYAPATARSPPSPKWVACP